MEFSIAIIVRNDVKGLKRLLYSIDHSFKNDKVSWPILIVTNGSNSLELSCIKSVIQNFQQLQIRISGVDANSMAKARQHALNLCETTWLIYIDTDCRVSKTWSKDLLKTCEYLGHVSNCFAWGTPALFRGMGLGTRVNKTLGVFFPGHNDLSHYQRIEHLPSSHLVLNADKVRALGGFNLRFKSAGEDLSLSYAIRKSGGSIWLFNSPTIWHLQNNKYSRFLMRLFNYGRAQGALVWFYPDHIFNRRLIPALWICFLVVSAIFSKLGPLAICTLTLLWYFAHSNIQKNRSHALDGVWFISGVMAYGIGTFRGFFQRAT